ncbi:FecCD family ABC transporter permease [Corynebacterium halotolerans]|uniref:FecCD family ABC transporter permease n=1 Tax=Corynebacterium halotolerans TaxID=225326 RepID=UPI003CE975D9
MTRALTLGSVILLVACLLSLFLGSASLSPAEAWAALLHRFGVSDTDAPSMLRQSILFDLRLPRVLMAAVVGASLAVAGVVMQAVTRNDLAEPYLLGVSSGASAGAVAVLTLLSAAAPVGLTLGAAMGALVSFGVLMLLLFGATLSATRVVLTGVLVGQLFSALTSLLLLAKGDADATRGVLFWLLGALGAARWDTLVIVTVVAAVALPSLWILSRYLDTMGFGDGTATTMGVPATWLRVAVLVIVALLTAATVSVVGAIGFIGLIVPHAVRMLIGPGHSRLIPLSAVVGAILLVLSDALARTLFAPQEIPVGVVTALIGVPSFFLILRRRQR